MKNNSPYKVVRALTLIFAIGLLALSPFSTASSQKEIPAACVEECRVLLFDCLTATGEHPKCVSAYRKCIAHCKH